MRMHRQLRVRGRLSLVLTKLLFSLPMSATSRVIKAATERRVKQERSEARFRLAIWLMKQTAAEDDPTLWQSEDFRTCLVLLGELGNQRAELQCLERRREAEARQPHLAL
jgi:hypothetical protein